MGKKCKCEAGAPGWLATFADLMSLLMCFFVLLLSFAQIDAVRFMRMAMSMKEAFGVQTEVPASEIVKGVSVIKQEFSPSMSDPTIVNEVRQETVTEERENLEVPDTETSGEIDDSQLREMVKARLEEEAEAQAEELQQALEEEIQQGMVTVERQAAKVIVRIQEKGSFPSGSARLDAGFYDVMDRISEVLATHPGKILVAGHSDDIPISTGRFRSNWELSSARAVTVLHALLRNQDIDEQRVLIEGHADTQPLVPNDSPENRARNRRVELIIARGVDAERQLMQTLEMDPAGEKKVE